MHIMQQVHISAPFFSSRPQCSIRFPQIRLQAAYKRRSTVTASASVAEDAKKLYDGLETAALELRRAPPSEVKSKLDTGLFVVHDMIELLRANTPRLSKNSL